MKRRVLITLVSLVSILAVVAVYFGFYGRENREINVRSSAASGSATLTSQAEWEAGTLDNIDSTSTPGDMEVDTKGSSLVNLQNIYDNDPDKFTADPSSNIPNMFDDDALTVWEFDYPGADVCANPGNYNPYWQVDLGQSVYIVNIQANPRNIIDDVWHVLYSTDGINFTEFGQFDTGWPDPGPIQTVTLNHLARYIRVGDPGGGAIFAASEACPTPMQDYFGGIYEFDINTYGLATHLSSSTQLDAGDHDTVEWTTFVPDDTIPANTSIEYRFRTSDDHSTWGDWTTSTASAASIDISALLGGTDNTKRYLQVESTLANTDGASTPTISAYTANYETSDTCDNFDHLTIQMAPAGDQGHISDGTIYSFTAHAYDNTDTLMEGLTYDFTGPDIGSFSENQAAGTANWTTPNDTPAGDYTVTVTSSCGGSASVTMTKQPNPEPEPEPENICDNFSHLVISPSSLTIGTNRSANILYYGVDNSGSVMSGLSEFLVVSTGTLVGNRYTAPATPGTYSMAASSVCGNASGTITVYEYTPPEPEPEPEPKPEPPPCIGDDCHCEGDYCWCLGENCECTNPEVCLPCVGDDCKCVGDNCWCTGDQCVCNDPENCYPCVGDDCDCSGEQCVCTGYDCYCNDPDKCKDCTGPDCKKKPTPICIGPYCYTPDDPIIQVAGSTSTAALGLGALIATALILLEGLAKVLTMIKPSELLAYLIKGRDRKHARGIVYDSSCGLGIPLAKVLLFRSRDQKLIRVTTSGSDGRFALETPPGEEYFIQVKKEGYEMRPLSIYEKNAVKYDTNYTGERFIPSNEETLFSQVIPLSLTQESQKYSLSIFKIEKLNQILRILNYPLLITGFVASLVTYLQYRTPYNTMILAIYLLIFAYYLIRLFFLNGKSFGFVTKNMSNEPIDLAIIRAISNRTNKLARTVVSDKNGHYTLAVNRGDYKISATKAGFLQSEEINEHIGSNFKPVKTRIHMNPNIATQLGENQQQALQTPTAEYLSHPRSTQAAANTANGRKFEDSDSIIEGYKSKFGQLGP